MSPFIVAGMYTLTVRPQGTWQVKHLRQYKKNKHDIVLNISDSFIPLTQDVTQWDQLVMAG